MFTKIMKIYTAVFLLILGCASLAHAQVCTPAPVGLVSWFAADGNALDSRSRNNGVLQGGATFATGNIGQAFSFDGTNSYVRVPTAQSLNPSGSFTIEAWIYQTTYSDGNIFSKWGDTGDYANQRAYLFGATSAGQLNFSISDVANQDNAGFHQFSSAANIVPLNAWNHVAAVYDQTTGTRRIYLNGNQIATRADAPVTITNSIADATIGARQSSSTTAANFFNGKIDEPTFYNRALSATEIQAISNSGMAGKCKPTATVSPSGQVAWLAGDGDARDISGNGNNGTLQNGAGFAVGKVGQGFTFNGLGNGNGSYVSTNLNVQPSALPTVTFETWVYPTRVNTAENQAILSGDPGGFGRQVDIQQGSSMFGVQTGTSTVFRPTTADVNQWQHIAVVYTPTDIKFYKNGVLFDSGIVPTTGQAANNQFFIGSNRCPPCVSAGQTQPFQGGIDEVSVYDRELSSAEIQSIVNAGIAGKLKQTTTSGTTATVGDATVTFASATTRTTQEIPLLASLFPALPMGTNTGLDYDIAADASVSNPMVCFNLPSFTTTQFPNLRIYHLESGVWQNRTAAMNTYPTLCTTGLTSLSPFAIGLNAPTAASVSIGGRVLTATGRGIRNARVSLTDTSGETRIALTNAFGFYHFADVPSGETYILSVSAKRYIFENPTQVLSVNEEIDNADFTALPKYGSPFVF